MKLREALITQSPSLALQRAAADEIAWLDAQIRALAVRAVAFDRIIEVGRYGITERNEAVVYLPTLVPAPDHISGLRVALLKDVERAMNSGTVPA